MSNFSTIEWTESTWNPVKGCTKISAGCANCYAEGMAKRLKGRKARGYENGFELGLQEWKLFEPYRWRKPRLVFVNSMSDLFHKGIPEKYILDIFKVMNENPKHTFQILTKRPERLLELNPKINWTPNIWMGVTVENRRAFDRIEYLKKTNAKVKFLSLEPLLESVKDINLEGINWVIVGGESGQRFRPMEKVWVEEIQQLCEKLSVPFFFKQWGGRNKKQNGRLLNGTIYDQYPAGYVPIPKSKPKNQDNVVEPKKSSKEKRRTGNE